MRYINLVNENDQRSLKYKISKFPDGQQAIDLEPEFLKGENRFEIISRLSTFRDLELIIGANQAIKELMRQNFDTEVQVSLYIPYFLGARSDRRFKEGGTNYLKNVICPVINSQNFISVKVVDPHSDVLEACISNFQKITNIPIVKVALTKIDNKNGAQDRIVLVSPDGGALKKIFDVAEAFVIPNIVTAMKHRDVKTGRITHTEVPDLSKYGDEHKFVIVDDIGDGFGTFIELAKVIKRQKPNNDIYLIVSHSIQEEGIKRALEYFKSIYTTNSVKDFEIDNLYVMDIFKG